MAVYSVHSLSKAQHRLAHEQTDTRASPIPLAKQYHALPNINTREPEHIEPMETGQSQRGKQKTNKQLAKNKMKIIFERGCNAPNSSPSRSTSTEITFKCKSDVRRRFHLFASKASLRFHIGKNNNNNNDTSLLLSFLRHFSPTLKWDVRSQLRHSRAKNIKNAKLK